MSRRQILRFGAAGSAAVLAGAGVAASAPFVPGRAVGGDPFTLGVASGDPLPDSVVLWTRLAPDPLAPDGHAGMANAPVTVEYEVAHDESFSRVVTRGSAVASRSLGHSVHPEINGLEPNRWYYYRFRAGSVISPVGRTRTAPPPGSPTARMSFAFASCQSWSSGYFTAYDHMSQENLDLVVHLGDYVYEQAWTHGRGASTPDLAGEAVDLRDYRLRYAQAKSDHSLMAAHAAFPWLVTMDDHEVDNQVAMARSDYDAGPDTLLGTDAWDGYVADRNTLLGTAAERNVRNLVVITGDRHHNYAANLRRDFNDLESAVVASEFTGTSIGSGGDGSDMTDTGRTLLAANPDVKFFNSQRGYVRVEVDHGLMRSDFRVIPYVRRPGAPVATRAGYVVQNGVPGVVEAWRPDLPVSNAPSPAATANQAGSAPAGGR